MQLLAIRLLNIPATSRPYTALTIQTLLSPFSQASKLLGITAMARLFHITIALVILLAITTEQVQPKHAPTSSGISPTSGLHRPAGSVQPWPNTYSNTSGNSLSSMFHRWYETMSSFLAKTYSTTRSFCRSDLTDSFRNLAHYHGRVYRYLLAARHDEREKQASKGHRTLDDAPHRRRIKTGRRLVPGAAHTAPPDPLVVFQTPAATRAKVAARAGMSLDEVPTVALWLEGPVRATERASHGIQAGWADLGKCLARTTSSSIAKTLLMLVYPILIPAIVLSVGLAGGFWAGVQAFFYLMTLSYLWRLKVWLEWYIDYFIAWIDAYVEDLWG